MSHTQRYVALLGRITLSLIFVLSAMNKLAHFDHVSAMLASKGLPAPSLLLGIALLVELIGGFSLLFGYFAHFGALALALWLVPVTLIMHNFWAYGGMEGQMQMVNFMKNVAIFGGLLYGFAYGAGAISIDARAGTEARQVRFIERHA